MSKSSGQQSSMDHQHCFLKALSMQEHLALHSIGLLLFFFCIMTLWQKKKKNWLAKYNAALPMYYLWSKEVTKNPHEGGDDMKREWLFNSTCPPLSCSPAPLESADAANYLHIYERSFTARLFIKCFNMLQEYGIRIESLNTNAQNRVRKWISWFMAGKKRVQFWWCKYFSFLIHNHRDIFLPI